MDKNHFLKICSFISDHGGSQIKIMGGEPTIHPQFQEFMKIAQSFFPTVSLFTNALSENLNLFVPRESDIITYNFRFRKLLNYKRLLLDYLGERNLEIQITPSVIKQEMLNEIDKVVQLAPDRIIPCLTLDCTADIFLNREAILSNYEYIWNGCIDKGYQVKQDHLIPLCFIAGSKIPMLKTGTNCTLNCAGLIDADYNLRFCNQYPDSLINIFDINGEPMEISSLCTALETKYEKILSIIGSKGCKDCSMFKKYCNGGCFAGKSIINSIIPRF